MNVYDIQLYVCTFIIHTHDFLVCLHISCLWHINLVSVFLFFSQEKQGTDCTGATASHGEGEVSMDFALLQPSGCIFYVGHAAQYECINIHIYWYNDIMIS